MKPLDFHIPASQALEILQKGAFLTTQAQGKVNTMTIGWGSVSFLWRKPMFLVMVRPSRHTHGMIDAAKEFTVTLPLDDQLKEALALCGSKSGRDMDKLAAAGLTALPGQKIATPVIAGNCIHYECRVVYRQDMDQDALAAMLQHSCYASGDYHTLYYGEIVACYQTEK
jgi:flavin reductase (DIM6/NTAB) family NADH-FMN oxidoreductase RutF